MALWQDVVASDADLAAHVRRCFAIRKHATLATLRRDGSPHIGGTEVEFDEDGEIYLGVRPDSLVIRSWHPDRGVETRERT